MAMPSLSVIVVGAGIGGLAAAIALRLATHRVTVLESHAEKSEAGYAIEIPSNAGRILQALGLNLADTYGCRQTGIDLYDAEARPMALKGTEERPSSKDAPNVSVHRQDYHRALRNLAVSEQVSGRPVQIRLGSKVVSYDAGEGSVELESGEVMVADLVVAADGNRSRAHKWIIGEEVLPHLTGLSNVRFALPTDVVLQCDGMNRFVQRGWEGRACFYQDAVGDSIMHYPCRNGTLQNFAFFHQEKQGDDRKRSQNNSMKSIALQRATRMDPMVSSIIHRAVEEQMYLWQIVDRDPLPRMYKDKLVIIGDASHPMQPKMGQGAAQAVEDAAVLGLVMRGLESADNLSTRLRIWEELRLPRASAIQLMSRTYPSTDSSWASPQDEEKARKYFPADNFPRLETDAAERAVKRAEFVQYAFGHDVLAEAEAVLDRKKASMKI